MRKKTMVGALLIALGMMTCACGKEKGEESMMVSETVGVSVEDSQEVSVDAESTEAESSDAESTEDANQETASTASAELGNDMVEGMITTIGENTFSVEKMEKKIVEGGLIEVGVTDEPCEISYSENTEFILCKVINGDMNSTQSSESPTTKESLAKDTMVKVTGSKTENGLAASKIVIYQFE